MFIYVFLLEFCFSLLGHNVPSWKETDMEAIAPLTTVMAKQDAPNQCRHACSRRQ